jgi:hypothetical protein
MFTALFMLCIISLIVVTVMVATQRPATTPKLVVLEMVHYLTECDLPPIKPLRRVGEGNWELMYKSPLGMYARQENVSILGFSKDDGVVLHYGSFRVYGDNRPNKQEELYTLGL